jgi:plasmid maintenance system antidote protein VapI
MKMSDLASQLRKVIIDSGLTHYAIGKLSGVDTAVIDRFVSGERDIRLETAGRIAEALGCKLVS